MNRHIADVNPMPECPACATSSAVRLQQVLRGATAVPVWVCNRCDTEWPADRAALAVDRRAGTDRRHTPRLEHGDRRR